MPLGHRFTEENADFTFHCPPTTHSLDNKDVSA